ncbi:DUF6318 family protein [Promicromonospora sp. Populi]|uniref:DUF6318 family protein n=1 Tax=Promicromonospora sp. Populi TaxID=3239420 RepID=UPI0034E2C630
MSDVVMRTVGLVVAAGLVLSACTGPTPDPDASGSATGDPTPTASASPSVSSSLPAKPERPAAMDRDDAEGAAVAAEYFIELYPYVMATGDTEEFEAMSHQACGFCEEALEQANEIDEEGWAYAGGESSLSVTQVYMRDEVTGIYPLDTEISQAPSRITGPNGDEIYSVESKRFDRRVEMGTRDGEWVVVTVAPIPGADQ